MLGACSGGTQDEDGCGLALRRLGGRREFEAARDRTTQKALARIRRLRRPLPPGFRLDRQEANER
jgi:hypothetical protein